MNIPVRSRVTIGLLTAVMLAITFLSTSSYSQQQTSTEVTEARAIMQTESPEETLKLLDAFLEKYPESRYLIQGLLDRGITTIAQLDPELPDLIRYAQLYFKLYPSEAIGYNNVAWALYEANAALDKAAAWADTAIALLPSGDSAEEKSDRAMVLDTVAHIAFIRGDISTGISKQKEAVDLAPGDDPNYFSYRTELGKFLVAGQQWNEAEEYLTEVLLANADDEIAMEAFDEITAHKVASGMSREEFREGAISRGIDRVLTGTEDIIQAKQAIAVNLMKLGLLMERAMEFAEESVRESGPEKGADAYKNSRIALAQIYTELGNYDAALATLEPVSLLISPGDLDYYVTKGNALNELGRKEEAIAAFLEVAPIYPAPQIMEPLLSLWEEVHGEESDLRETMSALEEEMETWHPEGSYAATGEVTGRVVLAELFTGSECPPCVAADLAFDALLVYYPPSVNAVLIYHEHIPGPDPMTNSDSVTRMEYYNSEEMVVGGTPTVVVNGVGLPAGGGPAVAAKSMFGLYSWTIEQELVKAPGIKITLEAERSDQRVTVSSSVEIQDPTVLEGTELKLRVALAEKLVHFEGGNGVPEHQMVVRSFVGSHDGTPVEELRTSITSWVDIAELESELLEYLTGYETDNPNRFRGRPGFKEKKHEIDESQLLLVAFVQDDVSKKVLQATILELK